jgi:hypothetical protein
VRTGDSPEAQLDVDRDEIVSDPPLIPALVLDAARCTTSFGRCR